MQLTERQKAICEQVVNVFETGSLRGDHGSLVIHNDGPHNMRQITYGRSQATEYSNLRKLIETYIDANGIFSERLRPFVPAVGVTSLAGDRQFTQLLREAGKQDAVMQRIQDVFFDERYFQPAMEWADASGFRLPLSALVVYDSFVHSGSVVEFLTKPIAEPLPGKGGREEAWIRQYVHARRRWLGTHSNKLFQLAVYRTQCFIEEIARNNWDLSRIPIRANGVDVSGSLSGE